MGNLSAFFDHITYLDVIIIIYITIPIYLTARFTRLTKDNYKLTIKDKVVYFGSILLFFILVIVNAFSKIE